MWKQSFWFALLGSVVATLAPAVGDIPVRRESLAVYSGGVSFQTRYYGSSLSEVTQTIGAGAVVGAIVGLVLYGCGTRITTVAGTCFDRVILAGLTGAALGLTPVLLTIFIALSRLRANESLALEPLLLLMLYGISLLLAYLLAVFAVRFSLRVTADEWTKPTTRYTALFLPVGAIAASASGIGVAWLFEFSTSASTVAVIVVVVALVLTATLAAARWSALYQTNEHSSKSMSRVN